MAITLIKWALYSADACISSLRFLSEIFTLSIAETEKLDDKADSNSFDLKTQEAAPVTETLVSFLYLATLTPTIAYLEAWFGYLA